MRKYVFGQVKEDLLVNSAVGLGTPEVKMNNEGNGFSMSFNISDTPKLSPYDFFVKEIRDSFVWEKPVFIYLFDADTEENYFAEMVTEFICDDETESFEFHTKNEGKFNFDEIEDFKFGETEDGEFVFSSFMADAPGPEGNVNMNIYITNKDFTDGEIDTSLDESDFEEDDNEYDNDDDEINYYWNEFLLNLKIAVEIGNGCDFIVFDENKEIEMATKIIDYEEGEDDTVTLIFDSGNKYAFYNYELLKVETDMKTRQFSAFFTGEIEGHEETKGSIIMIINEN